MSKIIIKCTKSESKEIKKILIDKCPFTGCGKVIHCGEEISCEECHRVNIKFKIREDKNETSTKGI